VGTQTLLSAITGNDNTRNNPAVRQAVKTYENNLQKYMYDEINIKVLKESYDNLVENVKIAEPSRNYCT
jgi:hypothetical protein